jgi:hypothetical protein
MAGKSGTSLTKKLGIMEGHRVEVQRAPDGFALDLPDGARAARSAHGTVDVVLAFFTERAALADEIRRLRNLMEPASGLWIAWPKKSARTGSDLTEDVVREIALAHQLADSKVCAIDETWSGLRLVIRLKDR